jgi:hypothetical protein
MSASVVVDMGVEFATADCDAVDVQSPQTLVLRRVARARAWTYLDGSRPGRNDPRVRWTAGTIAAGMPPCHTGSSSTGLSGRRSLAGIGSIRHL